MNQHVTYVSFEHTLLLGLTSIEGGRNEDKKGNHRRCERDI